MYRSIAEALTYRVADILDLPFPNNYFDSIWTIAVFHHIPSVELRVKALTEMKRVLKRNGKIIMTCWNLYQPSYLKLLLKFFFRKLLAQSRLDFKDIFVPWKKTKIQRYYHAFTRRQLEKLARRAGLKVEKLYKDKYNYYLVLTK